MGRRHRILFVGPLPPPYHGSAVMVEALCHSLDAHSEFEAIHIDTADRRGISNLGRWDLTNICLALVHGMTFLLKLAQRNPEIVYVPISQNTPAFLRDCLFLLPAVWARKRLVIHLHGGYFRTFYDSSHSILRWLIRYILGRASCVIVLGENLRSIFSGLIDENRIEVVPNGIDPSPFQTPEKRGAIGRFEVTYLGSLIKSKGYRDVLEAASLVWKARQDVIFTMIGGFKSEEDALWCEHFVADHKLQDCVSFTGELTGAAKAARLLKSDIFVFPTYFPYEGHPVVVLEAMAAGLPVVTTDHGAIREMVLDGLNGFLVTKHDPCAIAQKIIMLLDEEDLRISMGEVSRKRFLSEFTLSKWSSRMLHVFVNIMKE